VAATGERVMAMISELKALFDEWIAAVAGTVESVTCRLVRRRQILLSEAADNTFTARLASARNCRMAGPALPCLRIGRRSFTAAVSRSC